MESARITPPPTPTQRTPESFAIKMGRSSIYAALTAAALSAFSCGGKTPLNAGTGGGGSEIPTQDAGTDALPAEDAATDADAQTDASIDASDAEGEKAKLLATIFDGKIDIPTPNTCGNNYIGGMAIIPQNYTTTGLTELAIAIDTPCLANFSLYESEIDPISTAPNVSADGKIHFILDKTLPIKKDNEWTNYLFAIGVGERLCSDEFSYALSIQDPETDIVTTTAAEKVSDFHVESKCE